MRIFLISLAVVAVFSCQVGQISAATFKTYAHANIVPGADATVDHLPNSKNSQFVLSGSAMEIVSYQVSTQCVNTDINNSLLQKHGCVSFDYPQTRQNPEGHPSEEQVITIVFE